MRDVSMILRNTLIITGIVIGLLFIPPVVFSIAEWIKNSGEDYSLSGKQIDPRALLAPYTHSSVQNDLNWGKPSPPKASPAEIFSNEAKTKETFKSYVGWRRDAIALKTLEISSPYGLRQSLGQEYDDSVWFFGGSTMWGTGATTSGTIPSQFFEITRHHVLNLGESNYNSRQGLNMLLNLLASGYRPKAVVFLDGVNDVANQCRTEITPPAHGLEQWINETLRQARRPIITELWAGFQGLQNFLVAPYLSVGHRLNIIDKYSSAKSQANQYNCHLDKRKAQTVVNEIFSNWHTVLFLSQYYDFEFRAVLQPNVWTTTSDVSYLSLRNHEVSGLFNQFKHVYRKIKDRIDNLCRSQDPLCGFVVDGTDWLDDSEGPIFIDYCHVTEVGNLMLAKQLAGLIGYLRIRK